MYKVFLNDRMLMMDSAGIQNKEASDLLRIDIKGKKDLKCRTDHFLHGSEPGILFVHPDIHWLWEHFKECFLPIRAAGGVVKKGDLILFIYRRGKWDLPKGKIDAGESVEQAALREVEEECGITGMHIHSALLSTWHIYPSSWHKSEGPWILKETCWFEMKYTGKASLFPQADEDITKAEWIPPKEMNKIYENTYPNLRQIIQRYF